MLRRQLPWRFALFTLPVVPSDAFHICLGIGPCVTALINKALRSALVSWCGVSQEYALGNPKRAGYMRVAGPWEGEVIYPIMNPERVCTIITRSAIILAPKSLARPSTPRRLTASGRTVRVAVLALLVCV